MKSLLSLLDASRTFGTGVVIGLSAVTPVFAATGDEPLTPRSVILVASLVLLGLALSLKARSMRQQGRNIPVDDEPDLRWWRNQ